MFSKCHQVQLICGKCWLIASRQYIKKLSAPLDGAFLLHIVDVGVAKSQIRCAKFAEKLSVPFIFRLPRTLDWRDKYCLFIRNFVISLIKIKFYQ